MHPSWRLMGSRMRTVRRACCTIRRRTPRPRLSIFHCYRSRRSARSNIMQEGVIEAVYSILSNSLRAERGGPGAYPKTKTSCCPSRHVYAACRHVLLTYLLTSYLREFRNHSHSVSQMVRKAPIFSFVMTTGYPTFLMIAGNICFNSRAEFTVFPKHR